MATGLLLADTGDARAAAPASWQEDGAAGNGLRAVGAIEAREASLGRPVITANQALLWQGLRVAGAFGGMDHYGRLFKRDAA